MPAVVWGSVLDCKLSKSNMENDVDRKSDLDNHANQMNPNHDAYWESRGEDERPDDWEDRAESDRTHPDAD